MPSQGITQSGILKGNWTMMVSLKNSTITNSFRMPHVTFRRHSDVKGATITCLNECFDDRLSCCSSLLQSVCVSLYSYPAKDSNILKTKGPLSVL
ncbi:hypothetical protein CEXT_795311 [Caerostris extrusa]|uniref:Uncharacterized protein n=1 Tax=Caerostris extrusa TaxID=172846 RepID=A0AAV4XTF6_CAEEX|nr:hypothetical protein CEXT_795311 [Caerostris extrusa]